MDYRSPVIQFNPSQPGDYVILVRLQSKNALATRLEVWQRLAFDNQSRREGLLFGLYFGFYLLLICAHAAFWLVTRAPMAQAALNDHGRTLNAIDNARAALERHPRFDKFRTQEELTEKAEKAEAWRRLQSARDEMNRLLMEIDEAESRRADALRAKRTFEGYAASAESSGSPNTRSGAAEHRLDEKQRE